MECRSNHQNLIFEGVSADNLLFAKEYAAHLGPA